MCRYAEGSDVEEIMKRRLILGLAAVLGLAGLAIGVVGLIVSQHGANNLGPVGALVALGSVPLSLVYTRLGHSEPNDCNRGRENTRYRGVLKSEDATDG